ncbi:Phage antirepressor protein KilAC domain protein [compost metagenome]
MKLAEMIMEPDNMIKLFQNLKEEKEKRIELQLSNQRKDATIQHQENVIRIQQPKVDYATKVLSGGGAHPVTIIAKELGMTAATFNKKLNERGIIFRVKNTWVLSSKYQNMGYTKNETYTYSSNGSDNKTAIHMLWTEKGREFLHQLFNTSLKTA